MNELTTDLGVAAALAGLVLIISPGAAITGMLVSAVLVLSAAVLVHRRRVRIQRASRARRRR